MTKRKIVVTVQPSSHLERLLKVYPHTKPARAIEIALKRLRENDWFMIQPLDGNEESLESYGEE